jgi:hypothetical protein
MARAWPARSYSARNSDVFRRRRRRSVKPSHSRDLSWEPSAMGARIPRLFPTAVRDAGDIVGGAMRRLPNGDTA